MGKGRFAIQGVSKVDDEKEGGFDTSLRAEGGCGTSLSGRVITID